MEQQNWIGGIRMINVNSGAKRCDQIVYEIYEHFKERRTAKRDPLNFNVGHPIWDVDEHGAFLSTKKTIRLQSFQATDLGTTYKITVEVEK